VCYRCANPYPLAGVSDVEGVTSDANVFYVVIINYVIVVVVVFNVYVVVVIF
jgi:hypothetical protein